MKEFVSSKLTVVAEDIELGKDYRLNLSDLAQDADEQTIIEVAQALDTVIAPLVVRAEIVEKTEVGVLGAQ